MQKVINFLTELYENNNREWFNDNKATYKEVVEICDNLTEKLITKISGFDKSVCGLTIKDCSYKIYRDIRFSPDKTPYKTHIGIYICKGGKKSENAGYYLHIQPKGDFFVNGSLICSGLYMPQGKVLKSVREEIDFNGKNFIENIKKAKGFFLFTENKLKKIPKDFSEDSEFLEYIKQKDFLLEQQLSNEVLLKPDLSDYLAQEFKKTYPFVEQINKAVDFAIQNY